MSSTGKDRRRTRSAGADSSKAGAADSFVEELLASCEAPEITLSRQLPVDVSALGVPVASDRMADDERQLPWRYLHARGFDGSLGKTETFPDDMGVTILAVGVGRSSEVGPVEMRRAGAALARAARGERVVATTLLDAAGEGASRTAAARALAEGLVIGSASSKGDKNAEGRRFVVIGTGGARLQAALDEGKIVGEAVNLARGMVNAPASDLTPRRFAEVARSVLTSRGVEVEVWDADRVEREGLGGLMAVARASAGGPALVRARYEPSKRSRGHVVLVGKGVTFDSGGLSMKSPEGMTLMRDDMGGGAAVLAALGALALGGLALRVTAIIPLAENMVDAQALKPGDVIRVRGSKTVEVLNTDAEGRLLLADALSLAAEEKPDAIVDVATLTGSCHLALGGRIAGLFSNNRSLADQIRQAALRGDEPVWELPLFEPYRKFLASDFADLKNVGVRQGAAIQAALFLSEFVPAEVPWAHLDIAGPVWSNDGSDPVIPRGATGFGVRLLVEFARSFRRPS